METQEKNNESSTSATSPNEVAISIPNQDQPVVTDSAAEPKKISPTVTQISKTVPSDSSKKSLKSFQARALFRKTVSYQKRQNFTNICCVCICPLMMVAIAGALSIVFVNLFRENARKAGTVVASLKHCSNVGNVTADNIPMVFRSPYSPLKDTKNANKVFDVSYYQLNMNNASEFFPCSNRMENTYPFTAPYDLNPGTSDRDTTFLPDPKDGWFAPQYIPNVQQFNPSSFAALLRDKAAPASSVETSPLFKTLQQRQSIPWNYIFAAAGIDIGTKPVPSNPQVSATTDNGGTGFLSGTNTGNFVVIGPNGTKAYFPSDFFVQVSENPAQFMLKTLETVVDFHERAWVFDPDNSSDPRPGNAYQLALLSPVNLTLRYPAMGGKHIPLIYPF